ncbi:MAG: GNAT family N-acetyltransferase [Candidatus Latescibacteria bacterium]|nr:GNAT family N-acetyltransferase [Candidatus Latescibacterota bacterium]
MTLDQTLDLLLTGEAPPAQRAAQLLDAAEAALSGGSAAPVAVWRRWLDGTRDPDLLAALPDAAARERWAEAAIAAVRLGGVTLETLLDQRVAAHPERPWLREPDTAGAGTWSYARARRKARAYAAALLQSGPAPRVALLTPNSVRGALADLACLLHGILVTPLSPQTEAGELAWILERLDIDTIVAGTDEQLDLARRAAAAAGRRPRLLHLDEGQRGEGSKLLDEICAGLSAGEVDAALSAHPRFGLDDVATVMFTSGSTGTPKGVAFSLGNLVTKRFARAAALPEVGRDEVLLCYLPLFHTFGRYLELLGTMFWGGEYVFAGNPSRETLLRLLPDVRPTGLIGIPLRWSQLREACLARRGDEVGEPSPADVRAVVGDRLRWGLSAAGHLAPEVFRFFHHHGVGLCSGFGMTEATGGITMTPPGDYRDDSVGRPLPGVRVRFGEEDELEISGPYVAAYIDGDGRPGDGAWLRTGDIFRRHDDGHLEIVDRLKDIYKNARGQTVAPRRVEQKFTGVPGIRRVFLVGDHRTDNVLLIVPDAEDPVLQGDPQGEDARAYFGRIVHAANADLLSYERVVNFAVLDRDFAAEHGELTPKGSYRRKAIEENFTAVVDELYRSDAVTLALTGTRLRVPRWLIRDLGILETELEAGGDRVRNRVSGRELAVAPGDDGRWRIGDLEYEIAGGVVDLGLLARQPLLWVGNPDLAAFCHVRDGWDATLSTITQHVYLPHPFPAGVGTADPGAPPALQDQRLARLHELTSAAFFGAGETAARAVDGLARALQIADHRTAELLRRRLEALSRHAEMPVRSAAYRVLLLDEPAPDYSQVRPKFLTSGLPFLDEASIEAITHGGFEERRLEAFRLRLHAYRRHLTWPADDAMHSQLDIIFRLLSDFARLQPAYYGTVRDELISWVLLREDPVISARAERHALALADWYEEALDRALPHRGPGAWQDKVLYQDGLSAEEIARLEEVLVGTTFLQQSVKLTSDGEDLDLREVPREGIWIGRTAVRHRQRIYRISVNTVQGKHYDLLAVIWDRDLMDEDRSEMLTTIFWLIALGGHPHGPPVLPRFGCYRPAMGALSLAFVSDLSVWERIREFAGDWSQVPGDMRDPGWRRLFVQALAAVFRGWAISGRRIVPGMVTPSNVAVSEPDFREGARILSLTGWSVYTGPLDLVRPMLRNYFKQTTVTYPWTGRRLDLAWIADACVEALGLARAREFLIELLDALQDQPPDGYRSQLGEVLQGYLHRLDETPFESCALRGAVSRFRRWEASNPDASPRARGQIVEEMLRLYGLGDQPELDRYLLYRRTWFRRASEATQAAFDALIKALHRAPSTPATRRVELGVLQETLTEAEDRHAFQRLAFPHSAADQPAQLLAVGDSDHRQVIVSTRIQDKTGTAYAVREPVEPSEYGRLYRLFFKSGYYKTISERDNFVIVLDAQERIVGGISWKDLEPGVVHLNGIVVATPLLGRGISSVLIEDFCARMANLGHHAVTTLFVLRPFFERHGFHLDKRWGGLVRLLQRQAP